MPRTDTCIRSLCVGLLAGPLLSGCGQDEPSPPLPPGPHVRLTVAASRHTHYEMLCDIRTYKTGPEQFANRYGIDTAGPFADVLPSPNAHCTARIDSGPSPIRITLSKPGSTQSMTIDAVGNAGKKTLHIW